MNEETLRHQKNQQAILNSKLPQLQKTKLYHLLSLRIQTKKDRITNARERTLARVTG